ncbi:MAG: hypothetical protein H6Q90_2242 [Deltaproteobacteria bacterium]|nr:hypothetical protein [Deltaproteobacteria bacterium]
MRARLVAMTTIQIAACAVVLAGCGRAQPPAAPMLEADTCGSVADHMVEQLLIGKDPRPPDATVDGIKNIIRARCKQDAWTVAAQDCLRKIQNAADADRCASLLSEEQQAALVRDEQAREGSGGGRF